MENNKSYFASLILWFWVKFLPKERKIVPAQNVMKHVKVVSHPLKNRGGADII